MVYGTSEISTLWIGAELRKLRGGGPNYASSSPATSFCALDSLPLSGWEGHMILASSSVSSWPNLDLFLWLVDIEGGGG